MRLLLALLTLALLGLSVLWITNLSVPVRERARGALAADDARARPVTEFESTTRTTPEPQRTAPSGANELDAPAAPVAPPDAFPRSRLAGRVERSDGESASGVTLEVRAADPRSAARPLAQVRTDEKGAFDTIVLGTGPFRLRAHDSSGGGTRVAVEHEVEVEHEVAVEQGSVQGGSLEILLELPYTGSVRGRVVDEAGEPVTSFTLELWREEDREEGYDEAQNEDGEPASLRLPFHSADGTFESGELAQGGWWLALSADGYAPVQPQHCRVPLAQQVLFRLQPESRLSGVVRALDGRPRAGARVELSSASAPVFTGADGSFEIGGGSGALRLRARDPSSFDGSALELVLAPGETRTGIVLWLGASGEISGQVIGLAGRPAAGRLVSFRALSVRAENAQLPPCETDELGRFQIDAPPGRWEVSAALTRKEIEVFELAAESEQRVPELRASEQVQVEPDATGEVWLALAPAPVRVSGALTKAGAPCAGGTVTAIDSRGELRYRARVEGSSYALGLARPGNYRIEVSFAATTQIVWIEVPAVGAHTLDLDVPVGWIEGFVRAADGQRAAHTKVWASAAPEARGGAGHALTDAHGNFTLELVPGTYTFGAGEVPDASYPWNRAQWLEVEADKRRVGLELVLPREPVAPALVVVLHGARGELLNDARVRLSGGPAYMPAPPPQAAPGGSAEFARLAAGEYVVWAEAPGHFLLEPGRALIAWNEPSRVELALVPAFEVVVRTHAPQASGAAHGLDAVDTRGRAFAAERVAASQAEESAEPEPPGAVSFRFPGLPAGEYRLRVFRGDALLERPLHVDAAPPAPLLIDLPLP